MCARETVGQGKLSRIESVPLRQVWPHEAADFTKWLAKDENLDVLSDALGIELELVETESSVGSFSADIFAHEVGIGRKVVIENQLEHTNHDHLGKIITYAAGKAASLVVWVVARARDEHRQAIEWLNEHTDSEFGFFLVEIELWSIDGSLPAPKFNVVERPNDWAKAIKASEGMSDLKKTYLKYWAHYREKALADSAFVAARLKPQNARPQRWSTIHIGASDYHLDVLASKQKHAIGIELYVRGNKDIGRHAVEHLSELESAVGIPGEPFEGAKDSGIRFWKLNCDIVNNPGQWEEFIDWQLGAIVRLRQALSDIGL